MSASRAPNPTEWKPIYWAYGAVIPATFFAFEAAQILSFEAVRAPNVGVAVQLAMMAGFFATWLVVPRLAWLAARPGGESFKLKPFVSLTGLAVVGLALSAAHLFLLALVLRIMHSPPGWGPGHLMHSFGEVWLGEAAIWLGVYAAVSALIVLAFRRAAAGAPARYEIRSNGRLLHLPLEDILWVGAVGNYSEFHTTRGRFTLRKTLSQVERELGGAFLRAHRSALVNTRRVVGVAADAQAGSYRVEMADGSYAPLSRRRLAAFRKRLAQTP